MNSAFKERGRRGGAPASVCGDAEKADILLLGLLAGNLVKKSLPVCHTRLRPGLHGKPEAWPRNHESGATPAPSDVTGLHVQERVLRVSGHSLREDAPFP